MSAQEDSFVDERIVSSPSRSSLARQRKYAPRSRNGCLTCKKRRKRCDEGVPHCQNCRRLNHRCVWGDKMPIEYGSTSRPSHLEKESVYQVENSLCIESKFPVAKSQQPIISQSLSITDTLAREHRYLLTFFIQELVPTISVTSSSTTYYTSLYVPMAFHSPAVLCAILAGAAYHLSKVTTDDGYGSRLKQLGMRMQQQCQTILGEYISHPAPSNENCEEIIATLMLLLGMETRNGSRSCKWTKQLACVRNIINIKGGPQEFMSSNWENQCLYQHFLYYDVMSSIINSGRRISAGGLVTSDDRNFNELPKAIIESAPTNESSIFLPRPSTDPLMGVSFTLFLLTRQIRDLDIFHPHSEAFKREYFKLEHDIKNWKNETGLNSSAQQSRSLEEPYLHTLAEAYRLSALISLYRRHDMHRHLLEPTASKILLISAQIPEGNKAETGLIYPLFIAGGELTEDENMLICASRCRGIRERSNMMNILGVEEVLALVWKARRDGNEQDWTDVLQEKGWVLNVA